MLSVDMIRNRAEQVAAALSGQGTCRSAWRGDRQPGGAFVACDGARGETVWWASAPGGQSIVLAPLNPAAIQARASGPATSPLLDQGHVQLTDLSDEDRTALLREAARSLSVQP